MPEVTTASCRQAGLLRPARDHLYMSLYNATSRSRPGRLLPHAGASTSPRWRMQAAGCRPTRRAWSKQSMRRPCACRRAPHAMTQCSMRLHHPPTRGTGSSYGTHLSTASRALAQVNLEGGRGAADRPVPAYPDLCFAVEDFDDAFSSLARHRRAGGAPGAVHVQSACWAAMHAGAFHTVSCGRNHTTAAVSAVALRMPLVERQIMLRRQPAKACLKDDAESEGIPGQVLAEPGWCYVVLLAAVGGIALFLPPRRSSAPGNQPGTGGPASQPADAPAASAPGPVPDAGAAQGRASGAAGEGGGDRQSGAGAAAGRSAAAHLPATRPAAEGFPPPGPGTASDPGADLAEGSVEPGGAGAPAEAAVADALRRWQMADEDDGGGGGARDADGAAGRASPPLQPAAPPSGQPDGREADGAGASRPEADRAASVPLFSGFVSYEMLEAVVVEGGRGAARREAGAHWVKMKGPGVASVSQPD